MPGMGGGGSAVSDPAVVAAFHAALRDQAALALVLAAACVLLWRPLARRRRRTGRRPTPAAAPVAAPAEPAARRLLRLGFGALWVADGLLQTKPEMALGLPRHVVAPAEVGTPGWVHALISPALASWSAHPVAAATSVVWVQLALGAALLLAPRWRPSRTAGALSAAWAAVVWVFGEAFGGLLGTGGSWLFGMPGAAALYLAAGVTLALPARSWRGPRLARVTCLALGTYFASVAVAQAWPGRRFWTGGPDGRLPAMLHSMALTPQPRPLSSLIRAAAGFASAHGALTNLVAVVGLGVVASGLLVAGASRRGSHRALLVATVVGEVLCLATWVVVQDLGFLGATGTDPSSMPPTAVVLLAVALARRTSGPPGGQPRREPTAGLVC